MANGCGRTHSLATALSTLRAVACSTTKKKQPSMEKCSNENHPTQRTHRERRSMSDWNYLNRYRVRDGALASDDSFGCNGYFCLMIFGEKVKVIASDCEGWQHISVSLAEKPSTVPNYKTMQEVRRLFYEDDQWVVQFSPPKSEHINNHPGCLHWWRPTDQPMPTPPAILVGLKALNV